MSRRSTDVLIEDRSSIFLLHAVSDRALAWVEQNASADSDASAVTADRFLLAGTLAVHHTRSASS